MNDARISYALAQFDARHTMGYWRQPAPSIRLPWMLAIPSYPIVIGARVLVWAGRVPLNAFRQYVSWQRPDTDAVSADNPFILVLRTFGGDGGLLLNPSPNDPSAMPRSVTLEQILGDVVGRLDMGVVSFADHAVTKFPRGIRYHKVRHANWRAQFEELAMSAAAIVAMSTPDRPPGPAFQGELNFLASQGLTAKTVVVAPPNLDKNTRASTNQIYGSLGWPQLEFSYLTAHLGDDGRLNVRPAWGRRDDFLADRYAENLEWALGEVMARS